ncbi:MAG: M28 family peptidase [Bacteroidales bacterium]|nr:M28 family peptidase [Bacteroidales bacterium]
MKRLALILLLALPVARLQAQDSNYARQVICTLASDEMFGRGMQYRGDSIAADFLRKELQRLGARPLSNDFYQPFRFPRTTSHPPLVRAGYRSQNVCAYIPGETDSMIVFTAHYDHLGMSGDTIFYGAHDNASGVAALLDLARLSNQQRSRFTRVFLFFGGEEAGLVGSRYFADLPLINLNKVKLLINIDLFCGGDEGMMVVNANDRATAPYVDLLQSLNDDRGYAAKIGRRDNAPNSDHYYFTSQCPAIFIYTLGGPYGGYHSPTDTCEGCGLRNYDNFMKLLRVFLEHIE